MSRYHAARLIISRNPLPKLYHGTDREIREFHFLRPRRGGKAIYATPSLINARSYGPFVYEVEPVSSRMFEPSQDMIELEEALDKLLERESRKPYGEARNFSPYTRSQVIQGVKDKVWNHLEHPLIIETLKKLGFDGFVGQEGPNTNYAFLNPKNLRIVQKIDVDDEGRRMDNRAG